MADNASVDALPGKRKPGFVAVGRDDVDWRRVASRKVDFVDEALSRGGAH